MKVGYYPGCSLEATARDYAESIEGVAELLDIDLIEIHVGIGPHDGFAFTHNPFEHRLNACGQILFKGQFVFQLLAGQGAGLLFLGNTGGQHLSGGIHNRDAVRC